METAIDRVEYPDGSTLEVTVTPNTVPPIVHLRAPGSAWRQSWHDDYLMTLAAVRACPSALEAYVRVSRVEGPSVPRKVAVRCPDCGDVEVVPDVMDRYVPASGECPACGDRLYFGV